MPSKVWCNDSDVNIDYEINMKTPEPSWLDAEDAISMLGVNRATLYAYVSRGRIRSEPVPGSARRRRYAREDIERLLARKRERRNPEKAAEQALHWGLPILESSITLIANERIYYRGYDAAELALGRTLAEVASLVWTGTFDGIEFEPRPLAARAGAPANGRFAALAQAKLALAARDDPLAYDLRSKSVAQTGWRILALLAETAARGPARSQTIDGFLAASWSVPDAVDLIRAALILCADHELNVSAFTARCVASAGASPYGVVVAGLAALEGFRHGGATERIEALWDSLTRARNIKQALAERLRRGERVEGFGHPLYPHGDPRARLLMEILPKSKASSFARRLAREAHEVLGERPTVDLALVALTRALGLPNGAALTLFAIGRTIGWIAQAIEQYDEGTIIRPRAKYVGRIPSV